MLRILFALAVGLSMTALVVTAIFAVTPFVVDQLMILVRHSPGLVVLVSAGISAMAFFLSMCAAVYYRRKLQVALDAPVS